MITVSTKTGVHEKGRLSLSDIINSVKNTDDSQKAGAIAVFIGVVRGETTKGERVKNLIVEAYEEKANEMLMEICNDLRKKPGIVDVQIHHLLGTFSVGEDLVYVLVAGSHRNSVFPALEEAVERYKKEVPIFKKECVTTGRDKTETYWVAERRSLSRV